MSVSVEKGVVVRIHKANRYDHSFEAGTIATSEGVDFGANQRGTWSLFRDEQGKTQYLLPQHYEVVETTKAVEPSPVILVDESNTGVVDALPTKAVYGVINAEDEIYATTADRDFARELKAALGGKRKGIRIFQYTAVKEIR